MCFIIWNFKAKSGYITALTVDDAKSFGALGRLKCKCNYIMGPSTAKINHEGTLI